jgi:DNA-binding transcriptional MerR regulator
MRIGELAIHAGVNAQTLRYYERRGLVGANRRTGSGYREYGPNAVRQVRFIRRAQDLGFTLDEIGDLLGLRADSSKSCSAVEKSASATLERIEGEDCGPSSDERRVVEIRVSLSQSSLASAMSVIGRARRTGACRG